MRGEFRDQGGLFSYIDPECRILADHPLRQVRRLVRAVLRDLSLGFSRLYSHEGRPSIPPQQLLSTLLLQVFYGLRSEQLLVEQLDYSLLFRWFVGLSPDDRVWDATSFTKNRERLQQGEVFDKFMAKLLEQPAVKSLLSDEHFPIDGTLIEAWASHKSFKPRNADKDDDGSNFHDHKRKNDTHASTSDPNAKLYRKAAGREARLSYMGHPFSPQIGLPLLDRSSNRPHIPSTQGFFDKLLGQKPEDFLNVGGHLIPEKEAALREIRAEVLSP